MSEKSIVRWRGKSGKLYDYFVHEAQSYLSPTSGNFIWAKVLPSGSWSAVYFGEAKNLNEARGELVFPCAIKYGATHLHLHTTMASQHERQIEQIDLVEGHRPPCNQSAQ